MQLWSYLLVFSIFSTALGQNSTIPDTTTLPPTSSVVSTTTDATTTITTLPPTTQTSITLSSSITSSFSSSISNSQQSTATQSQTNKESTSLIPSTSSTAPPILANDNKASESTIIIVAVVIGVAIVVVVGIYIFRKAVVSKSTNFRNRMDPNRRLDNDSIAYGTNDYEGTSHFNNKNNNWIKLNDDVGRKVTVNTPSVTSHGLSNSSTIYSNTTHNMQPYGNGYSPNYTYPPNANNNHTTQQLPHNYVTYN
ncbi:hypothetical protein HK099_003313 [Clydaea vesicula]|uniref:Mid2 domain-containing protein n=1 Tax=Clydaea vesicula TaxID=447962 RepID=A0AAD5XWB7_9FUNG|nr:hypothetical protein HK099_003313 [Clydaea vesicula]KAJ3386233.1 hypothetical protein HDU92_002631 [Lobulomyces angularis]